MLHTGGTTGEPKGVLLSNLNVNTIAVQHEAPSNYDAHYCAREDDRLWPIVPMFYGYGLASGIHVALCFGMEVILTPQPDVTKIFDIVNKYKPHCQ